MRLLYPAVTVHAVVLLAAVSGCGSDDSSGGGGGGDSYDVTANDSACELESSSIPSGKATFKVDNQGSDVTEVYVYGKDGDEFTKIMGEVENIGPGTSQDFSVDLAAGDYEVACKPGMTGDGIRSVLTVTGDDETVEDDEALYDREVELVVEDDGTLAPVTDASSKGTVGEKIEFKLANGTTTEHYLVLLNPSGGEVAKAEAAPDDEAEFVAELTDTGDYTIQVYAGDAENQASEQVFSVSS
ncbi:MAG: cupredoxin domain-containing protein [Nocardioidaceae bacterium]|nr:cupredoxin domain-containing protein [Nocardioidaceae bacterium]